MSRAPRPIRSDGDVAYVPLTKGYEAIIDVADVPRVSGFHWHARVRHSADGAVRSVYAAAKPNGKTHIHMHRILNRTPEGYETDHVDGNGLNNRRANLRTASTRQNQGNSRLRTDNTTQVKGVYWDSARGKFSAQLFDSGKNHHLGRFDDIEAARTAVEAARKDLHGAFARPA